MWSRTYKTASLVMLGVLCVVLPPLAGQKKQTLDKQKQTPKEKEVWNYDGGVLFETDGTLPNGVCFRVRGQMNSGDFFDGLKRIDTENDGALFRRGAKAVAQFPESVTVSYAIRDQLCPSGMQQTGTRRYLTEEMIKNLRVFVYWKHGVDLRPAKNVKVLDARVDSIQPYAVSLAAELPRRFEWSYELAIPSEGVPLSDGLAFIFRTPDGRIAARVAARL